jgi:tRNA (guanine37-N1)-methyltransferase
MLKYFYKNNMKFYTISLFPNTIESYVNESILGRAIKNKLIEVKNYQLRDFSKDKHRRTDGIPYGGGPGMVM